MGIKEIFSICSPMSRTEVIISCSCLLCQQLIDPEFIEQSSTTLQGSSLHTNEWTIFTMLWGELRKLSDFKVLKIPTGISFERISDTRQ